MLMVLYCGDFIIKNIYTSMSQIYHAYEQYIKMIPLTIYRISI